MWLCKYRGLSWFCRYQTGTKTDKYSLCDRIAKEFCFSRLNPSGGAVCRIAGHSGGMQGNPALFVFPLILVSGGKYVCALEDSGNLCFIYGCWSVVATWLSRRCFRESFVALASALRRLLFCVWLSSAVTLSKAREWGFAVLENKQVKHWQTV